MMRNTVVVTPSQLEYRPRRATVGDAAMAWVLPLDRAREVHAGFGRWDSAEAPAKTPDYDEFLYVLEGRFGVQLQDGSVAMAEAGEVIFVPKGTTVHYRGEKARFFFVASTPESLLPAAATAQASPGGIE